MDVHANVVAYIRAFQIKKSLWLTFFNYFKLSFLQGLTFCFHLNNNPLQQKLGKGREYLNSCT